MNTALRSISIALGLAACDGGKGDDCPVGSERCPCTMGKACDPGLSCYSDLCVDPNGATESGADATGGGSSSSTSTTTTSSSSSTSSGADEGDTGSSESSSSGGSSSGADDSSSGDESSSEGGTESGTVEYVGNFTRDDINTLACNDWNVFRGELAGHTFTRVTMAGSEDSTGRTCTGPAADTICQAIYTASSSTIGCGSDLWSISSGCFSTLEVDVSGVLCDCGYNYTLRACSDLNHFGGLGTDSCDGQSQIITLTCAYE